MNQLSPKEGSIGLVGQIFGQLGIPVHTRALFRAIQKLQPSTIYPVAPENQFFDPYDLRGLEYERGQWEIHRSGLSFWPWAVDPRLRHYTYFTVFETTKPKLDIFNGVGRLCTASNWGTEILKATHRFPVGGVIHAGVDTNVFKPSDRVRDFNQPPKFLFVAKAEVRKSLDIAIKAFYAADIKDARLSVLVTNPFDHNFNPIEYIKSFNLPSKGVLDIMEPVNAIEGMVKLYQDHDFLLFPSKGEAIGLPLLEAMASGCVPIATKCTAIPEYVGNSPFLVEVEKEEDVYDPVWFKNSGEYGKWSVPSVDSLVEKIKIAAMNYRQGFTDSILSVGRAREFTWENAAIEALREINS